MTWNRLLSTLFVLTVCSSCVKAPEVNDTETTPDAVLDSIANSWGNINPFSAEVNDFVSFTTTQKIETNPEPFFILREGVTVGTKQWVDEGSTEVVLYKYNYQYDVKSGKEQTSQTTKEAQRGYRRKKVVNQTPSSEDMQVAPAAFKTKDVSTMSEDYNLILGFERASFLAGACFTSEAEKEACNKAGYDSCERKCVNLKVEEILRPVPEEVKAQPNCGGFENCKWKTKVVSFDLIQSYKKGSATEAYRANFWSTFVPELNFLGRMTDFCIRQLLTITTKDPKDPENGRRVLVNTCTSLTNYKPHTP